MRWMLSLPSRERGLKFQLHPFLLHSSQVAPLAGAWIEIPPEPKIEEIDIVAPLAGAWIEIV